MNANVISLIAGARGTGKTSFIKEKVILPSPMQRKLIVDTFDSPVWQSMECHAHPELSNMIIPALEIEDLARWNKGLYRCFSSEPDFVFQMIDEHLRNALIIFEDASKYMEGKLSESVRKFCYDSKQKNLNLVFVFHSLADIPPKLIRMADTLTLFKTNEGLPSKTKYPFPTIPAAMDHVRESKNRYENITLMLN